MRKYTHSVTKNNNESGNIFFALFGAVALVGIIGASTVAIMRGPLSTMVEVQSRTQAESEMAIASRLSLLEATQLTADGDCDADGFVEPLEFTDAGGNGPTGGGFLPSEVSSNRTDPWGTEYGYCAWDAGSITNYVGTGYPDTCDNGGGSSNGSYNRLAGSGSASDETYSIVAIISAGANMQFETTCTGGATPDVTKGGDDIVVEYTYESAVTATNGLWNIKTGEPGVAEIDKEIEVAGNIDLNRGGSGTGQLLLGAGSMIYPDQTVLNVCPGAANVNIGLIRMNRTTSPLVLEICDTTGWVSVGGTGVWTAGTGDDIYYNQGTPQVGIGTTTPDNTLDIVGTFDVTGAVTFGSTLDVTGATTVAGLTANNEILAMSDLTVDGDFYAHNKAVIDGNLSVGTTSQFIGAADFDSTLNVDGTTTLGNDLTVLGNTTLDGTLSVNLDTLLQEDLQILGLTDFQGNIYNSINDLNLDDNVIIADSLDIQGPISNSTDNVSINDNLDIVNDLDVNGNADIDGTMEADDYTWNGNDFTPATCASGNFNRWDGTSWVCEDDIAGTSGGSTGTTGGIWENSSNLVRIKDSAGDWNTDDFVFGSDRLADVSGQTWDDARMFFDKSKSSFRVGRTLGAAWDNANVGDTSFASGFDTTASGDFSTAMGGMTIASGDLSTALGSSTTASGVSSTATGEVTTASGAASFAAGYASSANGDTAFAMGTNVTASGNYSFAFGLGIPTGSNPTVSSTSSFGIFMGNQGNYNLSTANRMALVGGDFLIDDAGATGSNGCIRYSGATSRLQFSHDCTTWSDMVSASSIVGGSDTQVQYNDGGALAGDAGLTYDDTNNILTVGNAVTITGQAGNAPTYMNLDDLGDVDAASPANGECLVYNNGSGEWEAAACTSSGTAVLSGITAATADNTINNAAWNQVWNWQLTGGEYGFRISENAASTGGAIGNQALMGINTLASSTAAPLVIENAGANLSFAVSDQAADLSPFVIDASGNVGIGTASPAGRLHINGFNDTYIGYSNGGNEYGVISTATETGTGASYGILANTTSNPSTAVAGLGVYLGNTNGYGSIFSSSTVTTGTLMHFAHDTSAFTGNMIQANIANGSGTFTGNFMRFLNNNDQKFYVADDGEVGAYRYCDEDGNNCFTTADVSNLYLSDILAATASNTIANGVHMQNWNWALTGATDDAFTFGETTAATGGTGTQSILKAATLASSTAVPFMATNLGNGLSFRVNDETGDTDTTPFVIDASGNVGIGISTPSSKLHINGDTTFGGILTNSSTSFDIVGSTNGAGSDINITGGNGSVSGGADPYPGGSVNIVSGLGSFGDPDGNITLSVSPSDVTPEGIIYHKINNTDLLTILSPELSDQASVIFGGNTAIQIPSGTTAQRPDTPAVGMMRYNATTNKFEVYENGAWVNMISSGASDVTSGIFEIATNVARVKDAAGDWAADDFVFGSSQLADVAGQTWDNSRMFFDKSKGAFRVGSVTDDRWDSVDVGDYSFAGGYNTIAAGSYSFAFGTGSDAQGFYSVAIGENNYAGATAAIVMGANSTADGTSSVTMGSSNIASGDYSTALGREVNVSASGDGSMGIGLTTTSPATDPIISGAQSFGIFMGNQSGYNLSTANRMALVGGHFLIDDAGATGSNGCLRYDGTNSKLQFSHDCSTYFDLTAGGAADVTSGVWEISSNVVRVKDAAGDWAADDFLFGSSQTADVVGQTWDDARMFFDKSKYAFRVGYAETQWDDANVGDGSISMGVGSIASGQSSIAIGDGNTASGQASYVFGIGSTATSQWSMALGAMTTASGSGALATGYSTTASGHYSTAMGHTTATSGYNATAFGSTVRVGNGTASDGTSPATGLGDYSMGIGLGLAAGTAPQVTGDSSLGIFMGDQSGIDLTASNTMSLMGGDLIIGSYQLDDTTTGNQDRRMFFDVSKGAFRAGYATGDHFDAANVGNYSAAFGDRNRSAGQSSFAAGRGNITSGLESIALGADNDATAQYSVALGYNATASGYQSLAWGWSSIASGNTAAVIGGSSTAAGDASIVLGGSNSIAAAGDYSMVMGFDNVANGLNSVLLGRKVTTTATATHSAALGLGNPAGANPQISGDYSYGIFMGDQSGYDLTSSNRMALVGGDFLIDDAGATGSNGCLRYDGTNSKLQFSHDCSTWSDMGSIASGVLALDDLSDAETDYTTDLNLFIGSNAGAGVIAGAQRNLAIGQNGMDATLTNAADDNTGVGYNTLTSLTSGAENTAFGSGALDAVTIGSYHTAVGYNALGATGSGFAHVAIGYNALGNMSGGVGYNIAVGAFSMSQATSGTANIGVGTSSLTYNYGDYNIALGMNALNENRAKSESTAIGYEAMRYADSTGTGAVSYNTAIGAYALRGSTTAANNTGTMNTAVGHSVMTANTTGSRNVAVGFNALNANLTGSENTALGRSALSNATGGYNVAVGHGAMSGTNAGNGNIGIGVNALSANGDKSFNVAIGGSAGGAVTTGNYNLLLGIDTGDNITTGSSNIILGYDVEAPSATSDNQLNIGNSIYGNLSTDQIAIGTATQTTGIEFKVSGTGGIILPSGTTAQRPTAIQTGMFRYNTTATPADTLEYYDLESSTWRTLLASGAGAVSAIDDLSDAVTDYTTDHNMRIGSDTAMFSGAANNLFIGDSAGTAGTSNAADNNIALGYQSLDTLTTGNGNISIGTSALTANTTGANNIAIGTYALDASSTTSNSIAIGYGTLGSNTVGGNTAVGGGAMSYNTGYTNVAFGLNAFGAGSGGASDTAAIGANALMALTSGNSNTAVGRSALSATTTGADNIAIGSYTGDLNTTGSRNILIGTGVDVPTNATNDHLNIGNTIYGDLANDYIGIGDFSADTIDSTLHLASGDIRLDGGAGNQAGCMRYDDTTDKLQFSHDCSTYSDMGALSGALALNDLSDAMANLSTDGNMFIGHEGSSVTAGSGIRNLMIGYTTGDSITTGDENVGIGRGALTSVTTQSDNTAIGNYALYYTLSSNNTAIGSGAMRYYAGTGGENTAIGTSAGPFVSGGLSASGNVSVGYNALVNTTAGDQNVAIGGYSLGQNQAKEESTAVGYSSMRYMDSTTTETPSYNSALGFNSLRGATTDATLNTGTGNTAIGHTAIQNITSGNNNTALGYLAGDTISSGTNNIAIGYNADFADGTLSNQLNIGDTIYGELSTDQIAIGTATQTTDIQFKVAGTGGIMIPAGTDAQRPATGAAGMVRYNSTATPNDKIEYYDAESAAWVQLAGTGSSGNEIFEVTGGAGTELVRQVAANAPLATSDFVFGSTQLADAGNTDHDARMFFDKSKGAFRAGVAEGTEWDDANIGTASVAMGYRPNANADYSTAIGLGATANAYSSVALGGNVTAGDTSGSGTFSIAMGRDVQTTANSSMAIGLGDATGTHPIVSAANSFGIFMGDQSGVDLADANTVSIMGASGGVGIGTVTPVAALDVVGNIRHTGIMIDASDIRYKTDIHYLPEVKGNILDRITQIKGYAFRMKDDKKGQIEYGVIAQELERVFPELVVTDDTPEKMKSVNYVGLIAPLIEATKELKSENDVLKAKIDAYDARFAALENDMDSLKIHTGFGISQASIGLLGLLGLITMSGIIVVIRRKGMVS